MTDSELEALRPKSLSQKTRGAERDADVELVLVDAPVQLFVHDLGGCVAN